jgi:ribonuclease P protein component
LAEFTFRKEEKLKKEKLIEELFSKGSSFHLFPFKVYTLSNPDSSAPFNQILISVPKKTFKKATDRNLVKRRIREAYRLNKFAIAASPKLLIAYIYTAKEILTFAQIQERLVKTFNRFDHVEKI